MVNKHTHTKKMLNITHYQRNENQNHSEVASMQIRIAAVKKSTNNKCWRGCEEKGTLLHHWWECKLVQPLWKALQRFLKKTENRTVIRPSHPTAVHIHQENQNLKRHMCSNVHHSTVYNSQPWKQPRFPPADEQISKCGTYTQWNITQLLKRTHLNQL